MISHLMHSIQYNKQELALVVAIERSGIRLSYLSLAIVIFSSSIGGLVVKLAVAIRDHPSQMSRPAPGSIPGRCICFAFCSDMLLCSWHGCGVGGRK